VTRQNRAGQRAAETLGKPLPPRDLQPSRASQSRNVRGGTRDPNRGAWCTSKQVADAVGAFDLDPFSNPRSHIVSADRCMLEDGGDGFGDGTPGSYLCGGTTEVWRSGETDRVWLQPDYRFVAKAFAHYEHTRWTALLRFDPRTDWMKRIYARSELVCVLWECEFEPPPGVIDPPGNTFPHALYYRYAADVTDAVLRLTISWRKKPTHG
jgi:hypothetical protein